MVKKYKLYIKNKTNYSFLSKKQIGGTIKEEEEKEKEKAKAKAHADWKERAIKYLKLQTQEKALPDLLAQEKALADLQAPEKALADLQAQEKALTDLRAQEKALADLRGDALRVVMGAMDKLFTPKEISCLASTSKNIGQNVTECNQYANVPVLEQRKNEILWDIMNIMYSYQDYKKMPDTEAKKFIKKMYIDSNSEYLVYNYVTHKSTMPLVLPETLTHLTFSGGYNFVLPALPNTLTHLKLSPDFNQRLPCMLPPNLLYLSFGRAFTQSIPRLPDTLTHLTINPSVQKLVNNPPNITHLTLGRGFNDFNYFNLTRLPTDKLTHLTFGRDFGRDYDDIPFSTKHDSILDSLPKTVTHLTFGYFFNHVIKNYPPNLTHLTFGYKFNQPIDNMPKSVTHLTFGHDFNQPIDNLLESVTHLTLGHDFNTVILPSNLKCLIFDRSFGSSPFNGNDARVPTKQLPKQLPVSLEYIALPKLYKKTIEDNNNIILKKCTIKYLVNSYILRRREADIETITDDEDNPRLNTCDNKPEESKEQEQEQEKEEEGVDEDVKTIHNNYHAIHGFGSWPY
jgi:hypothetical protein